MKLKPGVVVVTSTEDITNPQISQLDELFVLNNQVIMGVKVLEVLVF